MEYLNKIDKFVISIKTNKLPLIYKFLVDGKWVTNNLKETIIDKQGNINNLTDNCSLYTIDSFVYIDDDDSDINSNMEGKITKSSRSRSFMCLLRELLRG